MYSPSEMITDTGIILDTITQKTFLEYDNISPGFAININYQFKADIQISKNIKKYLRSYVKLQDVAGKVFGLWKVSIIFVSKAMAYNVNPTYELFLYSKFLNLEIEENCPKEGDEKKNPNYNKEIKGFGGDLQISNINEVLGKNKDKDKDKDNQSLELQEMKEQNEDNNKSYNLINSFMRLNNSDNLKWNVDQTNMPDDKSNKSIPFDKKCLRAKDNSKDDLEKNNTI